MEMNQADDEGTGVTLTKEDPIYLGDIDEVAYCCPSSSCVTNNDQSEVSGLESSLPPDEPEFEEYAGSNIFGVNTDAAASGVNTKIGKHSQVSEHYPQNARANTSMPLRQRIARYRVFVIVICITLTAVVLGFILGFGRDEQGSVVTNSMEASPSLTPVPTSCMVSFKPTPEVLLPSDDSTTTTSPSISSHRTTSKPFARPLSSHQPVRGHIEHPAFKPSRSPSTIANMIPQPSKTLPPSFAKNTRQPSIAQSPVIIPTPRPSSKNNMAVPSSTQSESSISAPSFSWIQSFTNATFFRPAWSTGVTPSVSSSTPIVPTILTIPTSVPSMVPSAALGPSGNPTTKPLQNPKPAGTSPSAPTATPSPMTITFLSPSTPVKVPIPYPPMSPSMERHPSAMPSFLPTIAPINIVPSANPSRDPTTPITPVKAPSVPHPSMVPNMERHPSVMPSFLPTIAPSLPSANPSLDPTTQPVQLPKNPTLVPTSAVKPVPPSAHPTSAPVKAPTPRPSTMSPTLFPIKTLPPTMCPSSKESLQPTNASPAIRYSGGPFANDAELRASVELYRSGTAEGPPISEWNVSGITNFAYLFAGDSYSDFNDDVSTWDMSSATTTSGMFYNAQLFDQSLKSWNTANIQDMSYMFYQAYSFNQEIHQWNVSKVESFFAMFCQASAFNQNISTWDVSHNVQSCEMMFQQASAFNQNLCAWGPKLQSSTNLRVTQMFESSGCEYQHDPEFSRDLPGFPFLCFLCLQIVE